MTLVKKKSLGQHFLRTKTYLAAIADAVRLEPGETVLEIGPGDGALTAELLARGARVIAVEKDHRLIPILNDKFRDTPFEVHEADALEFDVTRHLSGPYKVVGNIPYYITGALLKKFLSGKNQPMRLVFLMQKEVAERIARSPKESILSLSVKAYGRPRYIKTVPAGAFVPPPQVDSGILVVEDIARAHFASAAQEGKFFELVRQGFSSKRKLLASNLKPLLGERVMEFFKEAGVPEKVRAEDVPLEQWLALARL